MRVNRGDVDERCAIAHTERMSTPQTHMSTRDVARLFGVSISTINRQARNGAFAGAVLAKAPGRHGAYTFDGAAVAAMVRGEA